MRLIATKVSLSVRNGRRVLHSLIGKFGVDVTERAGFSHVYRRNLITLAKPHDKLSGGPT